MIYISGISIALFVSALLVNKKNKSRSDFILMFWMILLSIHLSMYYTLETYTYYEFPTLILLIAPLPVLECIFLYYYVASVTNQFPKKKWISFCHLFPVLLSYIYLIPFLTMNTEEKRILLKAGSELETFRIIGLFLVNISGVFYVSLTSYMLYKHKKNIRNNFSDIEEINLSWLKFLIFGIGFIWVIVIIYNYDPYIFSTVSFFVILIGFFGVQQKDIFISTHLKLEGIIQKPQPKEKYAKSGLTKTLADDLYNTLISEIEKNMVYKVKDLSLNDLADRLNTHPNYLSQVINEKEKKSFYDFINHFRLNAFKQMIEEKKHEQFTLLALAYECGFNSKSSFNRYFKKSEGITPTQFISSQI